MSIVQIDSHARRGIVNIKKFGWAVLGFGLVIPGVVLPVAAYLAASTDQEFSRFVGWANILALTVAASGAAIVSFDKLKGSEFSSSVPEKQAIYNLADRVLHEQSFLLSQLLGTDSLELHPALIKFKSQNLNTRRKAKKNPPKVTSINDIEEFYRSECNGRMVILGAPGSGKTVLSTWLSVELLKSARKSPSGSDFCVPIPLNISTWDPKKRLEHWMLEQVRRNYQIPKKLAHGLIRSGALVPFIDNLDEIDSEYDSVQRSRIAVQRINEYIAYTPEARIVVVSRSGEKHYERLSRRIKHARHVSISPLNPSEVIRYIEGQCHSEQDRAAWEPFLAGLRGKRCHDIMTSFGTPWRLTAAVSFYLSGGDPAELLPRVDDRNGGRNNAGIKSYEEHISKILMRSFIVSRSKVYSRTLPSAEVFMRQLVSLARLVQRGQKSGLGNEVNLHAWWRTLGPKKVVLLQVLLITQVLGLIFSVWIRLVLNTDLEAPDENKFTAWIIIGNYGIIKIYAASACARRVMPVSFGLPRVYGWRSWSIVLGAALFALISAAAIAETAGYLLAVAMFVSYTSIILMAISLTPSILKQGVVSPKSPLVDDWYFCLAMGASLAAASVSYFLILFDLPLAVTYASMAFMGSLLASFYVRNLVAQYVGVYYGLPLRFAKFLHECQRAGILRSSGFSYKFRNQELEIFLMRK